MHLVRYGSLGHVGRFEAVDGLQHRRGARVICRTSRGLEVGQVLSPARDDHPGKDGQLLRRVTDQDELLITRIRSRQQRAYRACTELLERRGVPAVLMDVEHLFDGQALFFYFLGEVSDELEQLTGELAEAYEAKVQFRQFTETLANGCGPDCGTADAAGGCSSGECSSCALAANCTRH